MNIVKMPKNMVLVVPDGFKVEVFGMSFMELPDGTTLVSPMTNNSCIVFAKDDDVPPAAHIFEDVPDTAYEFQKENPFERDFPFLTKYERLLVTC